MGDAHREQGQQPTFGRAVLARGGSVGYWGASNTEYVLCRDINIERPRSGRYHAGATGRICKIQRLPRGFHLLRGGRQSAPKELVGHAHAMCHVSKEVHGRHNDSQWCIGRAVGHELRQEKMQQVAVGCSCCGRTWGRYQPFREGMDEQRQKTASPSRSTPF